LYHKDYVLKTVAQVRRQLVRIHKPQRRKCPSAPVSVLALSSPHLYRKVAVQLREQHLKSNDQYSDCRWLNTPLTIG
jgi:hypothetical protein